MPSDATKDAGGIRWLNELQRLRPWLIAGAVVAIGALLFAAMREVLAEVSYAEVMDAVRHAPPSALVLALLATAASYALLTGYDRCALRYVGARVPCADVAETSFIAYALGNTIGLGVLTGGAVRMRMYGAAGLEAGVISRAIAFNTVAFGIGAAVVGSAGLLWDVPAVAAATHLPAALLRALAGAILLATAGLLWRCHRGGALSAFGVAVPLPSLALALTQLAVSVADMVASAAVLYALLPAGAMGFAPFLGFYAAAVMLGLVSSVPGGLGVFEAVMLLALGGQSALGPLAAALVLYRVVYYVIPLGLALMLLVMHELREGVATPVGRAAASLSPLLLGAFTLVVGVMLLVSGVTPVSEDTRRLLALHVPLSLVEASHFLGSIAGLGLLIVARGLLRRLDGAWWAGVLIGAVSLVLTFPRGMEVPQGAVVGFMVLALALSRRQFTRRASLLAQPITGGWLLAVAAVLAAVTGLLFFAYRDVQYSRELWWQFEFDASAPRSLRALVATELLALVLALRSLLRPRGDAPPPPDTVALERAAAIVRAQDYADAGLALTGDKQLLFSESGRAFVMFGRRGGSWVALFDPVGPRDEWAELVWRFIERARAAGARPSFYQVRPLALPLYLDAGLRLFKLGEYAYVPLPAFSLKGPARANLRHTVSRAEREGLTFEVVPVEGVPAILSELKAVSDAWLAERDVAEKGFSLGSFDEAYLRRQPVARALRDGRTVAFATLLTAGGKGEASVDLMRHVPGAPTGVMDFLFTRLLMHFQAEGFQRFGLGMAPLAGMAEHPLAPRWHRVGRLLFAHGEQFYNFQGLRAFKKKFDPVWEPRYLASPGGLAPLFVLPDIAALIGGGLKGLIAK